MTFANENELIVEAARISIGESGAQKIRALLAQPLDWQRVFAIAQRNAVLALVASNLQRDFANLLPAEINRKCQETVANQARHNFFYTQKLLQITELLESNRISVLSFKGPTLALRAYKNLGLRQFGDLDILIRQKDVQAALQILQANGYKLVGGKSAQHVSNGFASRTKDIGLISADERVRLELHWKLSGSHFALPIQMNSLWSNCETAMIGGKTVKTLPFNDLLIYLCLHGARHGWERLGWICDIAALVRAEPQIDWQTLEADAARLGCERALALALLLIYDLWRIETPPLAQRRLTEDQVLQKIAAQIRARIFADEFTPNELTEWYSFHLKLRENQLDRWKLHLHYSYRYARTLWQINETDEETFNLPGYLSGLYFVLRPLRLLYERLPKSGAQKDKLPQP